MSQKFANACSPKRLRDSVMFAESQSTPAPMTMMMMMIMMIVIMIMMMMVGIDHPLRPCAADECK